jgi:ribosomal protein S6E (S10)
MDLNEESERATEMLKGKVVAKVIRHRNREIGIEFTDGTRLFVDAHQDEVELSITGGSDAAVGE